MLATPVSGRLCLGRKRVTPTCGAEGHRRQDGQDGPRGDEPSQEQAEWVEEQAGPEKPVKQVPGSARRGHCGARVTPCLLVVLLKAIL